jgi:hypothetical protein
MIEFDGVVPPSETALLSPSIAEFIVVTGAMVSMVKLNIELNGPSLPSPSNARTSQKYVPSASDVLAVKAEADSPV